ncbi:MAG: sugar-binding transcriptional regulator [Dethiobacteria bacterium]|jgi:central glycolytic genes regulator
MNLDLGGDFLNLLAPEFPEILVRRYRLLRKIYYSAPVGRRTLAAYFQVGERVLRREVTVLREQGLLAVESRGIRLTSFGEAVVLSVTPYLKSFLGLTVLEEKLLKLLKVKRVIVVPGDLESDEVVLLEMGRAAARILRECLVADMVLAVSGGTSCAAVADMLPEAPAPPGITVVPARGGLGEVADYQANTIAVEVAQKLNARYRLLYLPDSLSQGTLQMLLQEEKIKEVITLINSARVLLHGIGAAEEMARCRGASPEEMERLGRQGAVGEVFGVFYNSRGEVVERIPSLGLYLEELVKRVHNVIVVAGGRRKARAIVAVAGNHSRDLLVLDEGAAKEILKLYGEGENSLFSTAGNFPPAGV